MLVTLIELLSLLTRPRAVPAPCPVAVEEGNKGRRQSQHPD
jgi:hypothetical protein